MTEYKYFKKVQTNFNTKLCRKSLNILFQHVLFAWRPICILLDKIWVIYYNNLFQVITGCDIIVRKQTSVKPTVWVWHLFVAWRNTLCHILLLIETDFVIDKLKLKLNSSPFILEILSSLYVC